MAEDTGGLPPDAAETVDGRFLRRPVRGPGARLREALARPDSVTLVLLGCAALVLAVPASFALAVPAGIAYRIWAGRHRGALPFRAPKSWKGPDYGNPRAQPPGGFDPASGILHLGRDDATSQELWIGNSDARRHGFFIGTTGSGKALPLDTPVLTPRGWVANGDLRPGDAVCHPDGGATRVVSVHPQGAVRAVRVCFADGRETLCSADHLWHVRIRPAEGRRAGARAETEERRAGARAEMEERVMEARDIGILLGVRGGDIDLSAPLAAPFCGPRAAGRLSEADAMRAAREGFAALDYMPSVVGAPKERIRFVAQWIRHAAPQMESGPDGLRLRGLDGADAAALKQIAWSLGGTASTRLCGDGRLDLAMAFDSGGALAGAAAPDPREGLRIVDVVPEAAPVEMSCIRVARADGLYVIEGHVATHNTELLLGVASQALMWSSGFLFIDGKGTTEFHARVWTLCKRFGREDDMRVLNFTDPGGDPDAPAGGPSVQSNTINPFSKGSPDQLINLLTSLMGDSGTSSGGMWRSRAVALATALMMALCELRDRGELNLDVQTIRDYLSLGCGVRADDAAPGGDGRAAPRRVEDLGDAERAGLRGQPGMIELYLRAQCGELSGTALLALRGFFETLPGFSLHKALAGEPQGMKCREQYGYLSMQFTRPLGALADGYGHIFRTDLGEVDIDDVVLNRRILVVLLPALQKAPEEMRDCGRIVVGLIKMMMGRAAGFRLQGGRREIVEARQTRSPSPYIVVLDEAGYYMVRGLDVMMAQARSLGFMIIVAGQDMAAMQAVDGHVAETVAANASLLAVGKTVDGSRTVEFLRRRAGSAVVAVASGYRGQPGALATRWVDRMDVSFQKTDRICSGALQSLSAGQFYFMFDGRLVRARSFFIGEGYADSFSVNKFVKLRDPKPSDSLRGVIAAIGALAAPDGSAPVESPPVGSASDESAPDEAAPVESASYEAAPDESEPVESAPIESVPDESAPDEAAPVGSAPIESAPVESAPDEAAPVESASYEAAPDESVPYEPVPDESAPPP